VSKGKGSRPAERSRPVRCAIYTRKSHEEGLDQEFNSLDVQREAGEAYVKSQAGEGWLVLPARYDDGGFSGATMDRPAMKRLLEDVEAGRVDVVVTYKVDRLSRSLLDFARLVELFDRKGVSFVSVTQQFTTTSSMGRLTLNVLLSFAQFEREVIAERIRDKFAASRKRGLHMGGPPVLGYDIDRVAKRLVVNPTEADLVRRIYARFIEIGSTTTLLKELNTAGEKTKAWTTVKGKNRPGGTWDKGHLYRLLNNPLYVGEVRHREARYPGEQEAIVERETWEQAQTILASNYHQGATERRRKSASLLQGLVRCAACNCGMTPTFSIRRGKIHRYYLCIRACKRGAESCPTRRVAAGELEEVVIGLLRQVFRSPDLIARALAGGGNAETERNDGGPSRSGAHQGAPDATSILEGLWNELFPAERERVVRQLVERVELGERDLELVLRIQGIESLVAEVGVGERAGAA